MDEVTILKVITSSIRFLYPDGYTYINMYAREEPFLFYQPYFTYLTEDSEIMGNTT